MVDFNDADLSICARKKTPNKENEAPSSIWKKMIGYKSIF